MKKYTSIITFVFAIICIGSISTFAQTFESLQKDFDAGMQGDSKAFKNAWKLSEELLAKNPKDAETLVLHGSATLFQAGQAFQTGNFGEGGKLWQKGQAEMDQAVKISPDNVNVLMTRGTTYLSASKQFPVKEEADRLFSGLSAGGQVEMPIGNSPWGTYFGMLRDKYGIEWMVDFDPR